MITITHKGTSPRVLTSNEEAVLEAALRCYIEALHKDRRLYVDMDVPRLALSTEDTIAKADALLEVLA